MMHQPETPDFTAASGEEVDAALRDPSSGFGQTVIHDVGVFTVALLPVLTTGTLDKGATGTLISFQGSYYILTAGHVAEMLKHRDTARVAITMKPEIDHRYLIDKKRIDWFGPAKPAKWNEWGPDIALLRIPAVDAKRIEDVGHGAFLNLSKERKLPLGPGKYPQCRVLTGTPAALSNYSNPRFAELCLNITILPLNKEPDAAQERDGFDCIDLSLDFHPACDDFGGVSGGGLWRLQYYKNAAIGKLESFRVLEGVAFWASKSTVRCHGPKSIGNVLHTLFNEEVNHE